MKIFFIQGEEDPTISDYIDGIQIFENTYLIAKEEGTPESVYNSIHQNNERLLVIEIIDPDQVFCMLSKEAIAFLNKYI